VHSLRSDAFDEVPKKEQEDDDDDDDVAVTMATAMKRPPSPETAMTLSA